MDNNLTLNVKAAILKDFLVFSEEIGLAESTSPEFVDMVYAILVYFLKQGEPDMPDIHCTEDLVKILSDKQLLRNYSQASFKKALPEVCKNIIDAIEKFQR